MCATRVSLSLVQLSFLGLLLNPLAFGQIASDEPANLPTRDPAAISLIQNAIAQSGGPAIATIQTIRATGTITPADPSLAPAQFVWADMISGGRHEFRRELVRPGVRQLLLSGHGNASQVSNDQVTRLPAHVGQATLPYYFPALILSRQLSDPNFGFALLGRVEFDGRPVIQVRVTNFTDEVTKVLATQDWYFTATSGLPIRVEYRVPGTRNASEFVQLAAELDDYRVVSGAVLPFNITIYSGATRVNVIKIDSLSINPSLAPSDFDAPVGVAQ